MEMWPRYAWGGQPLMIGDEPSAGRANDHAGRVPSSRLRATLLDRKREGPGQSAVGRSGHALGRQLDSLSLRARDPLATFVGEEAHPIAASHNLTS